MSRNLPSYQADPVDVLRTYDTTHPDELSAAMDRVRGVVFSDEPRARPWRRRRLVAYTATLATAAAVAVVAVIAVPVTDKDSPLGASPAAAAVLNQAAAAALRGTCPGGPRGPVPLRVLPYRERRDNDVTRDQAVNYLFENAGETWTAVDGRRPGWAKGVNNVSYRFFCKGDQELLRKNGAAPERSPYDEATEPRGTNNIGWQQPSPAFVASLPTEPKALMARLRRDTRGRGQSPDKQVLVYISDLLRGGGDALISPELRAALYRVMAMIPGIDRVPGVADLAGRKGVAIGRVEGGDKLRWDLIIDPKTGRVIGEREVLLKPSGCIPKGTAVTWTTLDSAVVDGIGQRPAR